MLSRQSGMLSVVRSSQRMRHRRGVPEPYHDRLTVGGEATVSRQRRLTASMFEALDRERVCWRV